MAYTEIIVAYSDKICVKESHAKTKLISYSNENDFAGISYSGTPRPIFGLRIEAKFFKERFPEENESEDLSDETVVKLSGSIKAQKLLQVEPIPYFMHRKLKFALQHNYIAMDSETWEKEESYEQKEINEKYPFESGECWLTKKEGGYFNNVYGQVII